MRNKIKSNEKNLFIVQNTEDFNSSEGSLISSIDDLNFKFSTEVDSFDNMLITRLNDIDIDYSLLVDENNEEWIPDVQIIGSTLNTSNLKLLVHFLTESSIDISDRLYSLDPDKLHLYDTNGNLQTGDNKFKILVNTSRLEYIVSIPGFTDSKIEYYLDVNYSLSSIEAYFESGYKAYPEVTIPKDKIRVKLNFSDGTNKLYNFLNSDEEATFSISESMTTWPTGQSSATLHINCVYRGINGVFNSQNKSCALTQEVFEDSIQEILNVYWHTTNEMSFYNEVPRNIVIDSIKLRYISGLEKTDTNISGVTFDTVSSSNSYSNIKDVTLHYKEKRYTISGIKVYAKCSVSSNSNTVPAQYIDKAIDFTGIEVIESYNNGNTKTRTLSSFTSFTIESGDSYFNNGKWSVNGRNTVVFKYYASETQQLCSLSIQFNVTSNDVELVEYTGGMIAFLAGSEINDSVLSRLPIRLRYKDGTIKNTFANKVFDKDNVEITSFETFDLGDPFNLLEKFISIKLGWIDSKTSLINNVFSVKRTIINMEPLKGNRYSNSTYSFLDDVPAINREVKVEKLSGFKFTYNGEISEKKFFLPSKEDGSDYTNSEIKDYFRSLGITLIKNIWSAESIQTNGFKYASYKWSESVELTTKINNIEDITVYSNRHIFQSDTWEESFDKLNFLLNVVDSSGNNILKSYSYSDIDKMGWKVSAPRGTTKIPCPSSSEEAYSANHYPKKITFRLKTKNNIGYTDVTLEPELLFVRTPSDFLVQATESSSFTHETFTIEEAICGDFLTLTDFGYSQKIQFTNGYETTEIDPNNLKAVSATEVIINNHRHIQMGKDQIFKWPRNGMFYLTYDEFNDIDHAKSILVECGNLIHRPTKIIVSPKNKNIVAGDTITLGDINIVMYGLDNEEIEVTPDMKNNYFTLSNNITKTTDTSVYLTIKYQDAFSILTASVNIPLSPKVCNLTYEVYENTGTSFNDTASVAGQYTYTVSLSAQTVNVIVDIPITINNASIYSLDYITAYKPDGSILDGVTFDPVSGSLNIPSASDTDLRIRFVYSTSYSLDGFGHAYSVTDNVLTGVYQLNDSKSTYMIPSDVYVIPCSSDIFKSNQTLEKLIITKNVTQIKSSAFSSCTSLSEIAFEDRHNYDSNGNVDSSNPFNTLSIAEKAFSDCSSLTTLDFSRCGSIIDGSFLIGTKDTSPFDNSKISKTTWTNCKLRQIKIEQVNFAKILRCHYIDDSIGSYTYWMTGRCAGGFKMQWYPYHFEDRETWMVSVREPGTGTGKPTNADVAYYIATKGRMWGLKHEYKYTKEFKATSNSSTHIENIDSTEIEVEGGYNFRDKYAGAVRSDRNANTWLACYGLGNYTKSEYINLIEDVNNYKFTNNGRDGHELSSKETTSTIEFVSVESEVYAKDFGNWDNSGYVNYCIYPNVKLKRSDMTHHDFTDSDLETFFNYSSTDAQREQFNGCIGGTCLDLMIPKY